VDWNKTIKAVMLLAFSETTIEFAAIIFSCQELEASIHIAADGGSERLSRWISVVPNGGVQLECNQN
jgi:hypothetical protein